jgi:hypothetical protein
LNESRIVAGGGDAAKIARLNNLPRIRVKVAGRHYGVQVANGVGKVDMIKEIEEFGAKFNVPGFGERESLD